MTDEEFVQAFESCELSNAAFHHRDHIRLAEIYVSRMGPALAADRFRTSLIRFAAHHGNSDKYHETITIAWLNLVVRTALEDRDQLLDKKYIEKFYSPELLASEQARMGFVEPDRAALPG
jgi:hypothetical protein